MTNKVCIIDGSRIPFCRSGGPYLKKSNQELMTAAMTHLVDKLNLKGKELGEVALGAVSKHSKDFNLARECTTDSGLSFNTPATDMQKACGTSLEATVFLANKIALGQIDSGIAGGCDTNSDLPIEFDKSFSDRLAKINYSRTWQDKVKAFKGFSLKELMPVLPGVTEPKTGLSMGESCELMAKKWNITREDQDELAYNSHINAANAYESGFYKDWVSEFNGLSKDNIVRPDTSKEKMAKLKPAFDRSEKGTLTAANSTSLTDGAACVFLCSEAYAKEHNLPIKAYFVSAQSAAVNYVDDEGLLMAPAYAVPKLLNRLNLTLQDFDVYEIHEAFAAQVLCTLKAWEDETFCKEKLGLDKALGTIDRSKMNIKGGSVALGHPFAATGARIVTGLSRILEEKGSGRGLISVCTAGGMGIAAVIERA